MTVYASINLGKEDKNCAGNGCINQGKYPLKIIYLNKVGWFCDYCKDQLLKDELIAEEDLPNNIIGMNKEQGD